MNRPWLVTGETIRIWLCLCMVAVRTGGGVSLEVGSPQVKGCISLWHCVEQAHMKAVVWSLAASLLQTYCLREKTNDVSLLLQGRWLCTRFAALSAAKCWERCSKLHMQPVEKGGVQRSLSASHNPHFGYPQTPDKERIHHIFLEREKSRSYINTNARFVMYLNGICPSDSPVLELVPAVGAACYEIPFF